MILNNLNNNHHHNHGSNNNNIINGVAPWSLFKAMMLNINIVHTSMLTIDAS